LHGAKSDNELDNDLELNGLNLILSKGGDELNLKG